VCKAQTKNANGNTININTSTSTVDNTMYDSSSHLVTCFTI